MLPVNPLTLTILFVPNKSGSLCLTGCHPASKIKPRLQFFSQHVLKSGVDKIKFPILQHSSFPDDAVTSKNHNVSAFGAPGLSSKIENNNNNNDPFRLMMS